jgi:16S rRNA (cytidine1402-2'-O)-methyltransferase
VSGEGRLVLVATPIGNLGDLSPRARQALADADVVCCEDTRRTRQLLSHAGISARALLSVHGHNEQARLGEVVARLRGGDMVVLVSDAGMPAVSDPGARLVSAAADAGIEVTVVPGPNAALSALVVSGMPTDRFAFEGFLPRKGPERRRRIEELATERRTALLFETAPRLAATLAELAEACGPERRVAVARELTKLHEEVWRGALGEAASVFVGREIRGELVIVVHGAPSPTGPSDEELSAALRLRLDAGETLREASASLSRALGVSRRRVYELGIDERRGTARKAGTAGDV